jgi:hypothetical protein
MGKKDAVPPGSNAEVLTRFGGDVLDYAKCEFVTMVDVPLPDGIKYMLNRAFRSFAWDVTVLRERWVETLPNGKKETEVFPHNSTDICCADAAAFTLYQSGKLNHDTFSAKLWRCNGGGFHWAPYWVPNDGNRDLVKLIKKSSTLSDFLVKNDGDPRFNDYKTIDDDWLPGDYLLYSRSADSPRHPAGQPGHINVYLGPFREIAKQELINPVYHILNASIGEGGGNAVVRPKSLDGLLWYLTTGQTVWHCRVLAIETLFREVVGYPVKLAKPKAVAVPAPAAPAVASKDDKNKKTKPKKEEKPKADPEAEARAKEAQISRLWDDAMSASTAYPIGRNLSWHDGIHLHGGDHLESNEPGAFEIVAFGPGQIALARMGGPSPFGDTSFVLLQHRLDPKTRRLLAPPAPKRGGDEKETKKKQEIEKRALTLYSLYMHLAPLSMYLHPKEKIEGVDALSDKAPPWLQRCWPQPVPPPREYVPQTAKVTAIITKGKDHKLVALTPANTLTAPHDCDKPKCRPLTVGGKSYLALPHEALPSNADSWSGHAPVAVVPKGSKLVYVSPRDHSLLELPVDVPEGTTLVALPGGMLDLRRVDVLKGSAQYVAINAFKRPGFKPAKAPFDEVDDKTVRVRGKLTLFLDTQGEGDKARLAQNQRATISATPSLPLDLPVKERSKAGKTKQADQIWLDFVPCVKLTPMDKADRELKLIQDVSLATEVNERLGKRQSSLFAVKIGKNEDWLLDATGVLVPNSESIGKRKPEAQVLTLYPEIKGAGKHRSVVQPKPLKQIDADSPALLAVQPSPDVAVQPLEVFEVGGRTFALVEIMFAVDASAAMTSHEEESRVKNLNAKRKKIVDKLMKREVVNFLSLASDGTLTDVDRSLGAEVIGRFGPDEARGKPSFHFEIFSGKNLIDEASKGSAGAAVPVPKTRWVVLKDDKDDLFTPAFIQRLLGVMMAMPPSATVDVRPLAPALMPGGVLKPDEWIAFYKANAASLSRVITVHKPEWAVPWEDVWKAKDTRGRDWTDDLPALSKGSRAERAQREEMKAALQAFHFWGEGLSLPGIDNAGAVFFYHPLRLIEWLKTGVDITVTGLAKPEDAVLKLILDGEEIPLEYDPISGAWSLRTFLGDIRQGKNAKLVLEKGIETQNKEINPVRIRRGEVTSISLVNPSLKVDVEQDQTAVGFAVAVKQASVGYHGAAYLLADGNCHLARSGYSRATFRVDVAYNIKPPDSVTITIDGDDLRFAEYAVSGIDVTADGDGKPIVEAKDKAKQKGDKKETADAGASGDAPRPGEDGQPGETRVATDHDEDAEGAEGDEPPPAGEGDEPAPGGEKNPEAKVLADGAVELPPRPPKREIRLSLVPPAQAGPIEHAGSLSISCEIMVTDAAIGKGSFGKPSAVTLKAKVSGGDLGDRTATAMRIKTREIRREKDGTPSGEDIAKLQLYLAQINAADHLPCYRAIGSHKAQIEETQVTPATAKKPAKTRKVKKTVVVTDEYDGHEPTGKKGEKAQLVQIDGSYGGELSRALWRFAYSFAPDKDWQLGAVKCTDSKGEDLAAVNKEELTGVPVEDLLDAHLPSFTSLDSAGEELSASHADVDKTMIERFLKRVNHPEEYPVVDGELLAEIVKRFRAPLVLPRVTFDIELLKMPEAHRDVKLTGDWNKNWIGTSALLPGEDKVVLKLKCPTLADVKGDVDVEMSVPEASGYRFGDEGAVSVKKTLRELCNDGAKDGGRHELVPSGEVDSDPKHNTVTLRAADGRLINRVELCGVPDLSKPFNEPSRAAAVLQIYLSVVAADPKKPEAGPLLKHTEKEKGKDKDKDKHLLAKINGKWDKSMVALLDKFKKAYGAEGDYPEVVKALKKAYDEASPAGAETAPAPAPPDAAGGTPPAPSGTP